MTSKTDNPVIKEQPSKKARVYVGQTTEREAAVRGADTDRQQGGREQELSFQPKWGKKGFG